MELTKQEQLFFNRVALKMIEKGVSLDQAAEGVLADDRRIVSKVGILQDKGRGSFDALSDAVYAAIRSKQVPQ